MNPRQLYRISILFLTVAVLACDASDPDIQEVGSGSGGADKPRNIEPLCKDVFATVSAISGCSDLASDPVEDECQTNLDDETCGKLAREWYECVVTRADASYCHCSGTDYYDCSLACIEESEQVTWCLHAGECGPPIYPSQNPYCGNGIACDCNETSYLCFNAYPSGKKSGEPSTGCRVSDEQESFVRYCCK